MGAFFTPGYYFVHPVQMLAIWNGGIAIQGGFAGGVIFGVYYCRKEPISFWEMVALLAPAIVLGQAMGRIACLLNGGAFGSPTHRGFGLVYRPGTGAYAAFGDQPLWPAEVWEGQADLIIFAIVFAISRIRMPAGMLYLMYGVLYNSVRFGLEFLRGDSPRYLFGWTAAQWTRVPVVAVCIALMIWLAGKRRFFTHST